MPGSKRLAPAGDDARLGELHHAVGEHLGVDPEVVPVAERGEHGVGDLADAHLQRGAVGDQRGDVAADLAADVVERLRRALGQRHVHRHELGDTVDVEEGIAEGARHVGIDLGEDQLGVSTAARTMSTETPRLTKPSRSGGLTWIRATSMRTRPEVMSCGSPRGRRA